MEKKWYLSKTLWANVLAVAVVFGLELSGEEITVVLAFVNIILRLVTKENLTL